MRSHSKLKILLSLENEIFIALKRSASLFLSLFIRILQFFLILKLAINFFSKWVFRRAETWQVLFSSNQKLFFSPVFLLTKSSKKYFWKLIPSKSVIGFDSFGSRQSPASHKADSLESQLKYNICTAWKLSVFGVILVCKFPHSDWIRRYTECGKILTRKSPNTDTFHVVISFASTTRSSRKYSSLYLEL